MLPFVHPRPTSATPFPPSFLRCLLYTFPQSVGIAGERPSSSYYFVGVQGGGLFYPDPHNSHPAVPLRPTRTPTPPNSQAQTHAAPGRETYTHGTRSAPKSLSPEYGYPHEHAPGRGQRPMMEDELHELDAAAGG
ncbi:hypothetical protein C8R44DRAFT_885423 [Mycena epipterygia]|nr:hypothetical protein C8R44DRAFT_885423 [Mycena epipterygia]